METRGNGTFASWEKDTLVTAGNEKIFLNTYWYIDIYYNYIQSFLKNKVPQKKYIYIIYIHTKSIFGQVIRPNLYPCFISFFCLLFIIFSRRQKLSGHSSCVLHRTLDILCLIKLINDSNSVLMSFYRSLSNISALSIVM